MCFHLNNSEYTKKQLREKTGLSIATVVKWMKLLKRHKLVHVVDWVPPQGSGQYAAVWAWGFEEVDKPKPKAKNTAEYSRRYHAKKREAILRGASNGQ